MEAEELNWIEWFVSLKGNEFFCRVEEDFLSDMFNWTKLDKTPNFNLAYDIICDNKIYAELSEEQNLILEQTCEKLYGLIHARFIISPHGLEIMNSKFFDGDFGYCPREKCEKQLVLPIGVSDIPGKSHVMLFCPRCGEVYIPEHERHRKIDGAYFGTTFPHLLLNEYPENCFRTADMVSKGINVNYNKL